jgi:lysyl-tRNA synthetase class I
MWTMVAALLLLLLIGYFTFMQNRTITLRTKKDLNELVDEYEKYKKKTRLEREKMTIDHFNEIKKLRGS